MNDGLVAKGLHAGYRRSPEVLRGVDLAVPRGAVTALIGPNGSGKSTLLRALLGLVPSRGDVRLDGADVRELTAEERARTLAYVPQHSELRANLPARSVVALGRFAHRRLRGAIESTDDAAIERALDQAAATHLADRPFLELSGGERQRILLARALASGARVLLLDEPTSSQDVRHVLELHGLLRALADDGFAILAVLHDLSEARHHTDRAVLLDRGEVRVAGPARRVTGASPIRDAFGVTPVEAGGLGYRLER